MEPTRQSTIYICESTWISVRSKLELLAYGTIITRKLLDTSTHRRNSVGINTNVVKYSSFRRYKWKSTYPASMSKYGYDDQCEWQCDKHDNYMFSMRISKNVNYSCWVHKLFEHVQKLRTGLPWLAWEERSSNRMSLSLSLLEWPGMTRNDLEWSLEPTWIVYSSSFGSRFGTVGLGHKLKISLHSIMLASWTSSNLLS